MDERGRNPRNDDRTDSLIEGGGDFAGAAAGGAIGLIGGPVGVIAGAAGGVAVARTIKWAADELRNRVFASRQEARAETAFTFAVEEIADRVRRGDTPREDGFFAPAEDTIAAADELLEGVFLHAADEYDQRKVPYLGWLYASIAFDSSITPGYAHYLLRVADRLTFRQFAALALFNRESMRHDLTTLQTARTEGTAVASPAIAAEITELGQSRVIGVAESGGGISLAPSPLYGGTDFRFADIAQTRPTAVGADLARLMCLDRIPESDVEQILFELGFHPDLRTLGG